MAALPNFIRSLRNEQSNDYWRYHLNTRDGEGAVVSYNFMTSPQGANWYGDPSNGFAPYSVAEVAATERALREYSKVADIKFVRGASQGEQLMFGQFNIQGVGGYASYPLTYVPDGTQYALQQIYIHANYGTEHTQYGYLTLLHEIGHALGLKHPHEGNARLRGGEDSWVNTVMSYNNTSSGNFKLGALDIIAVQSIYGPAKARMGADTYKFGATKVIWDGGGRDTVTASHLQEKVSIDLTGGSWSYIGAKASSITAANQVWIGHFTVIENAIGGAGGDKLRGNDEANLLGGRGGNDTLIGLSGRDRLFGGAGADTFTFKRATDSTVETTGRDLIADFSAREGDKMDLRSIDARADFGGNQAFNFIGKHAFHNTSGELRYDRAAGGVVVSGDTTGDSQADFAIFMKGVSSLGKGYFLL
ncbi:M10 family metallopeptidase [Microvirga sp. P5_D2]